MAAANANAVPAASTALLTSAADNAAATAESKVKAEMNVAKCAKNALSLKRKDIMSTSLEAASSELATSTASNEKKYSCGECSKKFAWEKNLKVHLRLVEQ